MHSKARIFQFSRVFDSTATFVFGIIMSLWASFFTDFWKRRQSTMAYDWEVLELEEEEPDRPDFHPTEVIEDLITGQPVKVYPMLCSI